MSEVGELVEFGSLEENEREIENGLASFVQVGRALARIRDDRQYVMAGFDTFEDYCRERWDMGRSNADRMIASAFVTSMLVTKELPAPSSERAVVPLAKLFNERGDAAVVEAWSQIAEAHEGEGPITGREVARFLKLGGSGANYGKPGWNELLGEIGDTLARADKQLAKLEAAVNRKPNEAFSKKAGQYAQQAQVLSVRLHRVREAP